MVILEPGSHQTHTSSCHDKWPSPTQSIPSGSCCLNLPLVPWSWFMHCLLLINSFCKYLQSWKGSGQQWYNLCPFISHWQWETDLNQDFSILGWWQDTGQSESIREKWNLCFLEASKGWLELSFSKRKEQVGEVPMYDAEIGIQIQV